MKRKYIKPTTEVFASIEEPMMKQISGGNDNSGQSGNGGVGARGTDFMEEDTNGKGFGYRRYNLWED
ncbi:MAG: hypothetical protein II854_02605 [Prevotella sp.]|nr:hypothetical protein [Prevotella sp.]